MVISTTTPYCQTDEAMVLCGLEHLRLRPDPDIVEDFKPFISTETCDVRGLSQRLRDWGLSPVMDRPVSTDTSTGRPVLTMASNLLVSECGSALVVLPERYADRRVLRVETQEKTREAASLEARENALAILADEDPLNLPHVDELQVACIDSAIETFGNRFTLVWRADEQQQIPQSQQFNDVVNVLPGSELADGWLKVVTLVIAGKIVRYVGRGLSDDEVIAETFDYLDACRREDSKTEDFVFCDPVIQSNGEVFVVHV